MVIAGYVDVFDILEFISLNVAKFNIQNIID